MDIADVESVFNDISTMIYTAKNEVMMRVNWLVMKMPNRKKIILFIVEEINDKINLASCLSQLLSDDEIHFEITDGDIVKKHSGRVFKQSDYLEVVHLIDTDGAFVPDENVCELEDGELIYEIDTIRLYYWGYLMNRLYRLMMGKYIIVSMRIQKAIK